MQAVTASVHAFHITASRSRHPYVLVVSLAVLVHPMLQLLLVCQLLLLLAGVCSKRRVRAVRQHTGFSVCAAIGESVTVRGGKV